MNERSRSREWPLALFTVAIQVACGLTTAAVVVDWRGVSGQPSSARTAALLIFPTVIVGVAISLLHLGRPLSGWRALANAKRSRLSQEVAAVAGFGCSSLAYGTLWYSGTHPTRLACGLATILFGVLAVVANARVYRIPAQPQLRTWWLIVSLFSVGLLSAALWPIFGAK